jgi:hypothetical protein
MYTVLLFNTIFLIKIIKIVLNNIKLCTVVCIRYIYIYVAACVTIVQYLVINKLIYEYITLTFLGLTNKLKTSCVYTWLV